MEAAFDVLRFAVVDLLYVRTDLAKSRHESVREARISGESRVAVCYAELARVVHRVTVEEAGASEAAPTPQGSTLIFSTTWASKSGGRRSQSGSTSRPRLATCGATGNLASKA